MNNAAMIQQGIDFKFPSEETDVISNIPLFLVEETSTHYILAIDIPGLPTENPKIRFKNGILSVVEEQSDVEKLEKLLFQFYSTTQTSRTTLKEGFLWIELPKYFINQLRGETL